MKNIFALLLVVLTFSACNKSESNDEDEGLNKFLGVYEVSFSCTSTFPGNTLDYNEVFFVELPLESAGLGENYLVFRNLFNDDDYNFVVNGDNFAIDFTGEQPAARGYYEDGNLVFTEIEVLPSYICTVPVTANKQ